MIPFVLRLGPNQAAKITRKGCAFTVEPMRFLLPYQAKREARAVNPRLCHHNCRKFPAISKSVSANDTMGQSVKTQGELAA